MRKKGVRGHGETLQCLFARSLKHCKNGKGYRFPDSGYAAARRPADFIWQGEYLDAVIECKQITSYDLRFDFYNYLYQNGQLNSLIEYASIHQRKRAFVCLNYTNYGVHPKHRVDEFYLIDYRFFELAVSQRTMKGLTLQYIKNNETKLIKSGAFTKLDKISIPEERYRILELGAVLK